MINLNRNQADALKYYGYILMLIDHITLVYFPQFLLGRIIGRFCAPIFFFALAANLNRTSNKVNYLARLVIWSILAQPLICYNFDVFPALNIMFSLAWSLGCLIVLDEIDKTYAKVLFAFVALYLAQKFNFNYGWYAPALVFWFYYAPKLNTSIRWYLWLFIHLYQPPLQAIAVFSPLLIYIFTKLEFPRLPRFNGYAFYSLHFIPLFLFV